MSAGSRRRLIVHAGTPKTGTTTLQILMGDQSAPLADRGVLVPRAGRGSEPHVGAHQALARSLLSNGGGPPEDAYDALMAELAASPLPVAVLSSENFCWLALAPAVMRQIARGAAAIGYDVSVLLYVRDQPGFAESVYAEFIKQGMAWDVDSYLDAVDDRSPDLSTNVFRINFDYARLTGAFAEVFGEENVRVRAFDPAARPAALVEDFGRAIRPQGDAAAAPLFVPDDTLHNPRLTFLDVLERLRANANATGGAAPSASELAAAAGVDWEDISALPFAFLTEIEAARIRRSYETSNAALVARFGVTIPADRPRTDAPARALQGRVLRAASRAWRLQKI